MDRLSRVVSEAFLQFCLPGSILGLFELITHWMYKLWCCSSQATNTLAHSPQNSRRPPQRPRLPCRNIYLCFPRFLRCLCVSSDRRIFSRLCTWLLFFCFPLSYVVLLVAICCKSARSSRLLLGRVRQWLEFLYMRRDCLCTCQL